ncbi:MAG: hypothetical protein AAGC46_18110, partial [Solirubrobacteraceae bacterium]|nr:hypothetical protein [Patulibacter sp.]
SRTARTVHSHLRAVIAQEPGAPVADAGTASLAAVAAALALHDDELPRWPEEPRPRLLTADQEAAWEARETIRLLGLDLIEVVHAEARIRAISRDAAARGRSLMAGRRHGRDVVIQLNESSSLITVSQPVEPFAVHACGQAWHDAGDVDPWIAEWLTDLAPTTRWDGVCVEGGPSGVALRRDEESARSWMHDLWLAEALADRAAVRAGAIA